MALISFRTARCNWRPCNCRHSEGCSRGARMHCPASSRRCRESRTRKSSQSAARRITRTSPTTAETIVASLARSSRSPTPNWQRPDRYEQRASSTARISAELASGTQALGLCRGRLSAESVSSTNPPDRDTEPHCAAARVAARRGAPLRAAGPSLVTRAFGPEHEVGLFADRTRYRHSGALD